jgi:hypothetical protein
MFVQNDLITWLLDNATRDYHYSITDLAARILAVNFAAIHNTTMVRMDHLSASL